jgi:DNA-binding CsgD family transcriptional regulator
MTDRGSAHLPRTALVERILSSDRPVVVVEAPAGTGKTDLLRQLAGSGESGLLIHDAPGPALASSLLAEAEGARRSVLAFRPGRAPRGLARARLYGRVLDIDAGDLVFTADDLVRWRGLDPAAAARVIRRTGGWACLIAPALDGDLPDLTGFLRDEVIADLPAETLVALEILLQEGRRPDPTLLDRAPFAQGEGAVHPVLAAVRQPMLAALRARLAQIESTGGAARIAAVLLRLEDRPAAIATLQRAGDWQGALELVEQGGGPHLVHRYGEAVFARILAGFTDPRVDDSEVLVLCRSIQAAKRGDSRLAVRMLHDRWGPRVDDPAAGGISIQARLFRILLRGWEDYDMNEPRLEDGFALLSSLPMNADLQRGSFYNAVLEVYISTHRYAEAEHVAVLARGHYDRAGVPVLLFYIAFHRAVLRMMQGDPAGSRIFLSEARDHLDRAGYDSPGDRRLLVLLEACIAYETGQADALTRFLSMDLDDLAQGEIWPSLIELVILYGTQALLENVSTMAARWFLDRWRVLQGGGGRFARRLDLREVAILQNANRWIEAFRKIGTLVPHLDAEAVLARGAELGLLTDRDEIGASLAFLRHLVREAPATPRLGLALDGVLENPRLTQRQRLGVELWRAEVFRRARRPDEALRMVQRALETAARLGSVASVSEERAFLDSLLSIGRIREAADASAPVRRLLRQVRDTGPGRIRRGRSHGLTRQEARILHSLCEGATNKAIANVMGLSEATVKFHLRNLYRKLGCSRRDEATRAAAALGLVG